MKQITKIQLHRLHWAPASTGGGAGERSDGKMNRIGHKTEAGDTGRQRDRDGGVEGRDSFSLTTTSSPSPSVIRCSSVLYLQSPPLLQVRPRAVSNKLVLRVYQPSPSVSPLIQYTRYDPPLLFCHPIASHHRFNRDIAMAKFSPGA